MIYSLAGISRRLVMTIMQKSDRRVNDPDILTKLLSSNLFCGGGVYKIVLDLFYISRLFC